MDGQEATELAALRKVYRAQFNAVCAARVLVSEAIRILEEDWDDCRAPDELHRAEHILMSA